MKKNLHRFASAALLAAVLMGMAVPASADGVGIIVWDDLPSIEFTDTYEENEVFIGTETLDGSQQQVHFIKPGCSIDILPNADFDGEVRQVWLHVGISDQVYYFESGWENTPFEGVVISFTSGVTKDGKVVDLSDPGKLYRLFVIGENGDGTSFSHIMYFRLAYQVGDSFVPLTIKDGVLTSYDAYYEETDHVTIPDSVTTIGQEAFARRDDIVDITIPNSVTTIGWWAFSGCTGLKEVVIPDSVTELGGSAFSGCTALERVVIGNGVTKLGEGAFADCPNLKSVVMGQNVEYIGDSAFVGCTGLTSLTLPQSVAYIGAQAFRNCFSLAEITIPETAVISDVERVFEGCPLLDIPSRDRDMTGGKIVGYSVYTTDTEYVFNLLFLYKNGTLDPLVDQLDRLGWDYYKNQTPQNRYGGDLGEYGRKTYGKLLEEASTEIILPEGVKTLAHLGWGDYNSIERLVLPNSLQVIGDGSLAHDTFYGCTDLKEIVFPDPEHISPVLKYQDIALDLAHCPSLERIVNCPDKRIYERMAANQRIEAAWKGIDPKTILEPQSKRITDLSNQICAGCATDYERAKAVFDWMTANISYDYANKYTGKAVIFPEDVLNSKLTICDGYTRLTQALLLAQNIPAVYISGSANNGSGVWEDHAWNMVYVDGRWIYIDSTWGDNGGGERDDRWFDVSLTCLSMSHWGENSYADPNARHLVGNDDTPTEFAATPNRSTVLVNGKQVAFDAYTINQNNYFKLRDLAKVLSGTGKQFEVTWDGGNNAINMLPGKPYTTVGGELTQGDGTDKTAAINTATVYLDGLPVSLLAYTIDQNNYFKLRDVGEAFDFDVTWDGARNTIVIDTTQSYTAD